MTYARILRASALAAVAAALAVTPSYAALDDAGPAAVNPLPVSPFEQPSAAGERLMLERAGLVPPPEVTTAPADGSFFALRFAAAATPGVDGIVNDPTDDTPENTTQSETTIAVRNDTLCAGYNNSGPGGFSGLSRSTDLGTTWTDLGGLGAGSRGDPVIVVDEGTGTFFYAEIATIGGNAAIGVARSTNDCQSFGAPVDAAAASSGGVGGDTTTLSDKPWIAVDNTGGANDGNVYVCWTRFFDNTGDGQADGSELRFSRSTDGGNTYVNEQVLQATGTSPFGCSVGVSPNGQVNVAWADRAGATDDDIRFRSSGDGGQNFNAAISISTGNVHPGNDTITNCTPNGANRPTLTGNVRMLHQAWLAVDATGGPFSGNMYAVWASDPAGTPDNSDVFFSRSTNGGANWSAAVQLGGGGGATDQFEPFVAVGGAGAVTVMWYDRRNDAANNLLTDVYKAFSSDGGATFGAIQRVTDQSFGIPQLNPNFDPNIANCYMGEYIAAVGDAHNFYYRWGDNRNTVTSAAWPAPTGRPDPDVWFELEVAPVVNNADLAISKTDSPDPAVAGEPLTYTLDVDNNGPHIALDVIVTDTLPVGVSFVSGSAGCTAAGQIVTCELGNMASGDSETVTINTLIASDLVHNAGSSPVVITNNASVTGVANDPNAANNSDSESTSVVAVADLGIDSFTVVSPPTELLVGQSVDVTLRKVVSNAGPSSPMDAKLTLAASAAPGASVSPALQTTDVLALAKGAPRVVEETVKVTCLEASSHSFSFTNAIAPLRAGDTDPNAANNTAQAGFSLICVVPVTINIKPGSDPNSVNPNDGGQSVAVAILTTAAGEYGNPLAFDATTVDPLSVRFGPAALVNSGGGGTEVHARGHREDSRELDERTRDGDTDLVLHFDDDPSGLVPGVTQACVRGTWVDGGGNAHLFFGCDAVRIVP